MNLRRRLRRSLAFCAVFLTLGAALASAAVAPTAEEGGWKGKTGQGFHVYFGVRGATAANFRLTIREVICGKQAVHLPDSKLSIDEAGHFEGAWSPTGWRSTAPSWRPTGSRARSSASKRPACRDAPAKPSSSRPTRSSPGSPAGSVIHQPLDVAHY